MRSGVLPPKTNRGPNIHWTFFEYPLYGANCKVLEEMNTHLDVS